MPNVKLVHAEHPHAESLPAFAAQTTEIIVAAKEWWLSHRPTVYSEADHLDNPTVNIPDSKANHLAEVVAKMVRLGM